jgi:hypothetical protein
LKIFGEGSAKVLEFFINAAAREMSFGIEDGKVENEY